MGLSTASAVCPVSGRRAKIIRKADEEARPQLVKNLLYDKYPKYDKLPDDIKALINAEVMQAVQKASNSYSLRPRELGLGGILEIAHHAMPVGFAAGSCGYAAYALNEPIVQDVLQGHWGKSAARVGIGLVLVYSAYHIVKDIFQSGAMHAPLAEEINFAASSSIDRYSPRDEPA